MWQKTLFKLLILVIPPKHFTHPTLKKNANRKSISTVLLTDDYFFFLDKSMRCILK